MVASMGPRTLVRGNGKELQQLDGFREASMGPRTLVRGNEQRRMPVLKRAAGLVIKLHARKMAIL